MVRRARGRVIAIAAAIAVAAGVATGQPETEPLPPKTPVFEGSAAPSAGGSTVESSDVPPWRASPPRFAVAPFENHSPVKSLDWLVAGAPFEIATKSEGVLGLEPTGGPLFVGATPVPADPGPIAAFAKEQGADLVVTGWFDRPNWELRLDIVVWRVTSGVAAIAGEGQRQGPPGTYHALLGEALTEALREAKIEVSEVAQARLARVLAVGPPKEVYAITVFGRGLAQLTTLKTMTIPKPAPRNATAAEATAAERAIMQAEAAKNLVTRNVEHDLERTVFLDPKCAECQRVLGELYLWQGKTARAAGKFNYAVDLAPDDLQALRAAARLTAAAHKNELAVSMYEKLVTAKPWDLDARYELGAALWATGAAPRAEHELEQVTTHAPDHLPARRVLALIHASRNNTAQLIAELEAIAVRAPNDLEIKADLATAYGAIGAWERATTELEAIAVVRSTDAALAVRIGDAYRKQAKLDAAIAAYARAGKLTDSSFPGFAAAQALFDSGRYAEATKAYIALQRFAADLPAAEQALGVIALVQGRPDDAAWYLRRATKSAPRSLATWQALAAAELGRKDLAQTRKVLDRARGAWPRDADLAYLSAVTRSLAGEDPALARAELAVAIANGPRGHVARAALQQLDAGSALVLAYTPRLARPWGDAEYYQRALDTHDGVAAAMTITRETFQLQMLMMLGELGKGPLAKGKPSRACPLSKLAPSWAAAKLSLALYEKLGVELEQLSKFVVRHDDIGATTSLLPNARLQVAAAKKAYRVALADVGELRAEWNRGLGAELRVVGCTERVLDAAVANPGRYHIIEDDKPEQLPVTVALRAKPRATFYVDNTQCHDDVEVWIDGQPLGHVAPGKRSALVADGGERALCLIGPGGGQCGDRGTVRQVYLHDGWSVTLHCPK